MPARYTNLANVEFAVLDGNLVAVGDRPLSESVLIVGPALDGPINAPISVHTAGEIETIFGPVTFNSFYTSSDGKTTGYSGNALMKALREVQAGGAADIRVMRVGGTVASGSFNMPSSFGAGATGTILISGRYNGRIYNSATITFTSGATSGQVVIAQPTVKGGNVTIQWSGSTSGLTIGEMIDRVNSHPSNRTVRLKVGSISSSAAARVLQGTGTIAGGTDGTIKDDNSSDKTRLYNAFTDSVSGAFTALADYEVDVIYLAGIYLDDEVVSADSTVSVAQDFAEFLAQRTVDYPIVGVIGCRPLDDYSSNTKITEHFNALNNTSAGTRGTNWLNAGYFMRNGFNYNDGTLDQTVDGGAYLQVVAGDVFVNDPDLGLYTETAAGIYAGTISSLKPHQAATHEHVNGIFGIPWQFSRAQLNTLVGGIGRDDQLDVRGGGGYVCLRRIERRGILFAMDVTAAARTSDFKNLQPLRIVNAATKGIREICWPFLGKTNSTAMRLAMETSIKSFLDGMAEAGALMGKDGIGYTLIVKGDSALQRLLGNIDIDLTLRPNLQIKQIRVRVRLSL